MQVHFEFLVSAFIANFQVLILLILVAGLLILPIIALVDTVKSKFPENLQIIWVLIILLLPVIGAIVYFLVGRNQKIG